MATNSEDTTGIGPYDEQAYRLAGLISESERGCSVRSAFRPKRAFMPGNPHPSLADWSAERIAETAGVHVTTARRWKRGESPPLSATRLIQMELNGSLGAIHRDWAGWHLKDGALVSDDGTCFTPGEVRAIPFMRMQIESYKRDQRFIRQADWIDEAWKPAPEQEELAVG